jgi:hypothetical protein
MADTSRNGDMPTEVRRELLLTYIKAKDFVKVSDLSARFGAKSYSSYTRWSDAECAYACGAFI